MRHLALLALLAACQPPPENPAIPGVNTPAGAPVGESPARIVVTGKDYAARAAAAMEQARRDDLSAVGVQILQEMDATVLVDNPAAVRGIPEGTKVLDLRKETKLLELLQGTDEKAAAEAIRATGARAVMVHHRLAPAFDRSSVVLSHLYHHDALSYFQLARVENEVYVYLVVDEPLAFPAELADRSTRWLRAKLEGRNPPPFEALKPARSKWRLVASLLGHGQEVAFSLAEAPTLDLALIEIADDLETMHRRQKEILGFPRLSAHMPGLVIQLGRVTETAYVVPRDEATLDAVWELGMDGAVLLDRPSEEEKKAGKKGQSGVFPGSVAATRSHTKVDQFLKALAREFRWDSVRPWRDDGVELQLIRTRHYQEIPNSGAVEMVRGTSLVPTSLVTTTTVRESILLAGEWYLMNLQPNGQVTYKFWPEDNRYSNEYNHVRHTLATWNLWQAWTLDPRPEFLEGALRAQKWTMQALVERKEESLVGWEWDDVNRSPYGAEIKKEGMAYYTHGNNTKLGSVVVGLLGMIEVAKATNDHSNDELMRKLGRFVLFMQEPSGTFRGYHVPPDHPSRKEVNDIVPGEAALALVYLADYFDDPRYLETLPRFFEYYKPWFKERADRRRPEHPWPMGTYDNATRLELVQFGPWTVMAASAYTRARPDAKDVATFGLDVARWMIETYEYTEDRTPYPDYVGGYYKFEGELPAMQAFCYAEGTAAAYDMALRMEPAQAAFFEQRARESIRFGLQNQHDALDTWAYARPLEIMGGIKYAMNEPKVRIDYVHHGLSAMYQWLVAARTDPNLPAAVKAPPDEALTRLLEVQDMPGFRAPGAPKRLPVPAAEGATPADAQVEDAEGGE